jgi:hypothetical protein
LRADLNLADGTTIPNARAVPDYVQVNASIAHKFDLPCAGALDVRFDIINLIEIRDGTGAGVGAPQFGPRRGFFSGLTKSVLKTTEFITDRSQRAVLQGARKRLPDHPYLKYFERRSRG